MHMKKYLFYISQNYSFSILRPVQKVLLARGDDVAWFFEGNNVNPEYLNIKEHKIHSVDDIFKYYPDAILAPANNIPSFLPGLKVAVFHGFDAGKLDNRGRNDHFKIRGGFDLYCTQGPNTTKPFNDFQKKMGFFNVIETGWPALDPLFNNSIDIGNKDKPIILLCSTFSKRLSCALSIFDIVKSISHSNNWQWLVQFHPKMDQATVDMYKSIQSDNLTFIETDNVIPLLKKADIMVCDTSSVISMFLTQRKPVVTVNNISPSPHLYNITDPEQLKKSISEALKKPRTLMKHINHFVEQTHPYTDGKSSQRVIDAIDDVLQKNHPLQNKKPLNFLRNLKFRKKLNYWKL